VVDGGPISALYERFASTDLDDYADKVLSAMRKHFGGHLEKTNMNRLAAPARKGLLLGFACGAPWHLRRRIS
jgi:hypothetical protein